MLTVISEQSSPLCLIVVCRIRGSSPPKILMVKKILPAQSISGIFHLAACLPFTSHLIVSGFPLSNSTWHASTSPALHCSSPSLSVSNPCAHSAQSLCAHFEQSQRLIQIIVSRILFGAEFALRECTVRVHTQASVHSSICTLLKCAP